MFTQSHSIIRVVKIVFLDSENDIFKTSLKRAKSFCVFSVCYEYVVRQKLYFIQYSQRSGFKPSVSRDVKKLQFHVLNILDI